MAVTKSINIDKNMSKTLLILIFFAMSEEFGLIELLVKQHTSFGRFLGIGEVIHFFCLFLCSNTRRFGIVFVNGLKERAETAEADASAVQNKLLLTEAQADKAEARAAELNSKVQDYEKQTDEQEQ